jgi:Protein of unknown function (DUF3035)
MPKMTKPSFVLLLTLSLTACSNARESLGLNKETPDEFAVVRHAPLEMPPSIVLPPPRPGMDRPQEKTVSTQAKQTLFGENAPLNQTSTKSSGEAALLEKTGALQADPNIRNTIDAESAEVERKNKPVLDKLLGLGGKKVENKTETLDPKTEFDRLRRQNVPTPDLPPEWDKPSSKKD